MPALLKSSGDLAAVTSYPTLPQVDLGNAFTPASVAIVNEHSVAPVYVSFDGVNDAGLLAPGYPSAGMEWKGDAGKTKVWFKRAAGTYTGTITCSVFFDA